MSEGRKFRREKSFRILEWFGRQFSDLFDWGDWWSVRTDDLAKVIIKKSISTQDALQNNNWLQVMNKRSVQKLQVDYDDGFLFPNNIFLSTIYR